MQTHLSIPTCPLLPPPNSCHTGTKSVSAPDQWASTRDSWPPRVWVPHSTAHGSPPQECLAGLPHDPRASPPGPTGSHPTTGPRWWLCLAMGSIPHWAPGEEPQGSLPLGWHVTPEQTPCPTSALSTRGKTDPPAPSPHHQAKPKCSAPQI